MKTIDFLAAVGVVTIGIVTIIVTLAVSDLVNRRTDKINSKKDRACA